MDIVGLLLQPSPAKVPCALSSFALYNSQEDKTHIVVLQMQSVDCTTALQFSGQNLI